MIALIGMSGLFPECRSIEALWAVIRDGRCAIRRFTVEELIKAGVPARAATAPGYVGARGWFDDPYAFDAELFGYAPSEALLIDPQQRLFLQESWRALEDAGYRPDCIESRVGVFAGCGVNSHLLLDLAPAIGLGSSDVMAEILGNEKDFLPTRVSYKLGLRGPSVNVQTACSTSLAAVHLACQSLIAGECDMAIAGGASVFPRQAGYYAREGGILAPDGTCRPFDAKGRGFVPGNGVAVVCLKRLEDAIADGDTIHLMIRGTAMTNDGNRKAGFTAPSFDGQVEAIAEALAVSDAPGGSIGYVEAHGTGTELGDPVEFASLKAGLRGYVHADGAALGALKGNIGHLDTAAGAAALIKLALVLRHGWIPAIANLERPNPLLPLEGSQLHLPQAPRRWEAPPEDRWACINALGLGGTNVHAVVSGPPAQPRMAGTPRATAPTRLVPLSGRSPEALAQTANDLRDRLLNSEDVTLDDVSFTLANGRFPHRWRAAWVCENKAALATSTAQFEGAVASAILPGPKLAFVFPGGGAQDRGMARALHAHEPVYRQAFASCSTLLRQMHGLEIAAEGSAGMDPASPLGALPLLFAVQWSLAQLWRSWGIMPEFLLGHSAGEYAAAALAGVFTLEDALAIVVARARLMQKAASGGMLSVQLSEADALRYVGSGICIAAVNSRTSCVLSAPTDALRPLRDALDANEVQYRPLDIAVAAHSASIDAILPEFAQTFDEVKLARPTIPMVSSVTGRLVDPDMIARPEYWTDHLRQTVRFSTAADSLFELGANVVIEVGPGQALTAFLREAARGRDAPVRLIVSLPPLDAEAKVGQWYPMLAALGEAWSAGVEPDWRAVNPPGHRIPLPTTRFASTSLRPSAPPDRAEEWTDRWAWSPVWSAAPFGPARPLAASCLMIGGGDVGAALARALSARAVSAQHVAINSGDGQNPGAIDAALTSIGSPQVVIELNGLQQGRNDAASVREGVRNLLELHQKLAARGCEPEMLIVGMRGDAAADGLADLRPADAARFGFIHSVAAEARDMACQGIELPAAWIDGAPERVAALLVEELLHQPASKRTLLAHRNRGRYVRSYLPLALERDRPDLSAPVRDLVITGGFGGIALAIAEHYAARGLRSVALLGPRLPPPGTSAHAQCEGLRAAGVAVLPIECDVTDGAALRNALKSAAQAFGRIDTAIHAAGRMAGGLAAIKDPRELDDVLRPKIDGAIALVEALRDAPPDRLVLFGALDAHLGTPGLADHCAANAFLEAFAGPASQLLGVTVTSIAWSAWRDVGQAAAARLPEHARRARKQVQGAGWSNAEGCDVLTACMAAALPAVIVCPGDLRRQIAAAGAALENVLEAVPVERRERERAGDLAEAESELEALACAAFAEVLGLDRVGATEDFFALGGHSLMGLALAHRLQKAFDIRLPLAILIRHSTPRQLAAHIEALLLAEIAVTDHV